MNQKIDSAKVSESIYAAIADDRQARWNRLIEIDQAEGLKEAMKIANTQYARLDYICWVKGRRAAEAAAQLSRSRIRDLFVEAWIDSQRAMRATVVTALGGFGVEKAKRQGVIRSDLTGFTPGEIVAQLSNAEMIAVLGKLMDAAADEAVCNE